MSGYKLRALQKANSPQIPSRSVSSQDCGPIFPSITPPLLFEEWRCFASHWHIFISESVSVIFFDKSDIIFVAIF
jgi:hypothetical protein